MFSVAIPVSLPQSQSDSIFSTPLFSNCLVTSQIKKSNITFTLHPTSILAKLQFSILAKHHFIHLLSPCKAAVGTFLCVSSRQTSVWIVFAGGEGIILFNFYFRFRGYLLCITCVMVGVGFLVYPSPQYWTLYPVGDFSAITPLPPNFGVPKVYFPIIMSMRTFCLAPTYK